MLTDVNKKKAAAVLLIFLSLGLNAQKIETHGTTDGSRDHVHVQEMTTLMRRLRMFSRLTVLLRSRIHWLLQWGK